MKQALTENASQPDTDVFRIKFVQRYRASAHERMMMIRQGVPAKQLLTLRTVLHIPKERLYESLGIPRATADRKILQDDTLSREQSERVIGLEQLIGQVEAMVQESGDPRGFDAAHWVGDWLQRPSPALGGGRPAEFLDTMEGQKLVAQLLAQTQSGAYA